VIDALAHVEHAVGGGLHALQGQLKHLHRRLISLCLLRRDYLVKFHLQPGTRRGEEIVVDVGENCQAKARFQLMKGVDGVGPRLPTGERIGEGAGFFVRGRESELRAEAADYRLQHFTIGMEGALFGEFLKVAIEFQKRGVFQRVVVGRKDAVKGGENAGFPVDQSSIAIEGKNFEALKSSMVLWCCSHKECFGPKTEDKPEERRGRIEAVFRSDLSI